MLEAFRLAVTHMTPVVVLSDGYLANSAEPWRDPRRGRIPARHAGGAPRPETGTSSPTHRDDETLARPGRSRARRAWSTASAASPRQDGSGNVSYDPVNNERMPTLRAEKVARIARHPAGRGDAGAPTAASCCSWAGAGPTAPSALGGGRVARAEGLDRLERLHLRHLNPFPPTSRRCCRASTACWCPSSTPGSWPGCCARASWWTPSRDGQGGQGPALQGRAEIRDRIEAMLGEGGSA